MKPWLKLTNTLWHSFCVTSAVGHCNESCWITIQNEHDEAKFLLVVVSKFYSTGSSYPSQMVRFPS